ncbi:MAG: actin, cytoplasmic 2 [Promethearchaeota archaeon]
MSTSLEKGKWRRPIVIENGSAYSKNGFAGEDQPRSILPTLIGYPRYQNILSNEESYRSSEEDLNRYYFGEGVINLQSVLKLIYPIKNGVVADWDALEKIWHYTFHNELRVNPAKHPVLLTETPLNPARNREKMGEILFETFNVPGLYISNQAVLALYASGRTTGLVLDIGADVTSIVPIYEGFPITHAIDRIDLAGRDVTRYLGLLLRQRGYNLTRSDELEIVREIKEKYCYVSLNPEKELKKAKQASKKEKAYTLPSGETIIINHESFLAPEAFFNPAVLGREHQSLSEAIYETIMNAGIDIRRELCQNIVLSGGSTMFPGMKERLQKELTEMVPESIEIRIVAPPMRQYSVWIGGSILSSLRDFQRLWITRKECNDLDRSKLYYHQIRLHPINDLSCPFCGGSKVLGQDGLENQTDQKRICVSCKNSF